MAPFRRSEKGSKYTQSYKNIKYTGSLVRLLYSTSPQSSVAKLRISLYKKGDPLAELTALTTVVSGL